MQGQSLRGSGIAIEGELSVFSPDAQFVVVRIKTLDAILAPSVKGAQCQAYSCEPSIRGAG
jgi:hypothetical protein